MTEKVAVMGAGPSGLSMMLAFRAAQEKGESIPEVVCFEKQGMIGGQWNLSWRTGVDEHGEPVPLLNVQEPLVQWTKGMY